MIDNYVQERQMRDRQAEMVRRVEFLRQLHAAEREANPAFTTGLRAEAAGLFRRAADRLDNPGSRSLLRTG